MLPVTHEKPKSWLWKLIPPWRTKRFELFDNAVFMSLIIVLGYIITSPPSAAEDALRGPFMLAPSWLWGSMIAAVTVVSVVCSYVPPWYRLGCRLLSFAALFWGGCFLIGFIAWGAPLRSLVSAMLYLWVASRMSRLVNE